MQHLVYAPGTSEEKIHELKFGANTIGREKDNSVVVMHESVSRKHAEIVIARDRVTIKDLESLNNTFVNELKIDHYELQNQDLIRCGNVIFKFVNTTPNQPESLENESSQPSVVKRFPSQQNPTVMQLLEQNRTNGSVLRLRQQNADQRAVDKLNILLEVSKQLSSPEESDHLLQKILDLLMEIMDVDRAAILMIDEATGLLECKAVKSRAGISDDCQFYSQKITDSVCKNGDAVLTADARMDFPDSVSIIKQAIHASMCVPLKLREGVIGVLYVDNLSMSGIYSDEDVEFLTGLANTAAIAIENSRLNKKMQAEAVLRVKFERFFPKTVSRKLREEGNLEIVDTEVTALFADISDFTKMCSTMAPRQVIEMLNEYFQVMVEEIVFAYEGTLEKYIGDALLAVWGAPYPGADDVERAVRAAIEMQWAASRLSQEWIQKRKQPIQIHIGLNTGKVAAGNIGSDKLLQYAAVGDTTNLTSRICNAAKAGEILISQDTFDRLRDRSIPLQPIPPVVVKGKDQPLQLYRVCWEQVPSAVTKPSR